MKKIKSVSTFFDVLCIIGMVLHGLLIALLIVAIANFSVVGPYLPALLESSGVPLDLGIEDPAVQALFASEHIYTTVTVTILICIAMFALTFMQLMKAHKALGFLKQGMPFHPQVSEAIFKIMWMQILICVLDLVLFLCSRSALDGNASLNLNGWILAGGYYLLGLIFRYGSTLKQEETPEIF